MFKDSDIKDEAFMEYINNILSSGEVANLFPKDELDEMLNNLTQSFRRKNPKGVPTLDNLYEFFINQAKNNLHLVLCFSPVRQLSSFSAVVVTVLKPRIDLDTKKCYEMTNLIFCKFYPRCHIYRSAKLSDCVH